MHMGRQNEAAAAGAHCVSPENRLRPPPSDDPRAIVCRVDVCRVFTEGHRLGSMIRKCGTSIVTHALRGFSRARAPASAAAYRTGAIDTE
jgi:hypothetical protein